MVDYANTGETPSPVPDPPKPKSAAAEFLSSSTGRLVVGGILLFIVVVAGGAFLFFSLLNGNQPAPPAIVVPSPGSVSTTAAVEATRPPDLPLDDTFTFRNVFAPTVKVAQSGTDSSSGESDSSSSDDSSANDTSSNGSSANVPADTLVLKSIVTDSGDKVASLYWNGTVYECEDGDQVDDSPWEVVTVYSDSVLMLYGDSRVSLTVGQGFSK